MTIDVPKNMAIWLGLKPKIQIKTHKVDLAFAFTDYKVQGLTVDALILMLNKDIARHDLATLYVGISRVTRIEDLMIWPIDHTDKNAIKHLVSIERPGFIRVWRKGYDKNGVWRRKLFAYIKTNQDRKLLTKLHNAGDLRERTKKELTALFKECNIKPPRGKPNMVKRLEQVKLELSSKNDQSQSLKRKQPPRDTTTPPRPKRSKPIPDGVSKSRSSSPIRNNRASSITSRCTRTPLSLATAIRGQRLTHDHEFKKF